MLTPTTRNIVLAPRVLNRAVARWRAGNYNATLDALVDESGNGLHARLGSAVGADSNDPLRLVYAGRKRLYLPAVDGNYPSTPDAVGNRFTTEIDIISRWSGIWSSGTECVGSKFGSAGQVAWALRKEAGGLLRLILSDDGTNTVNSISSAGVPFADGADGWVRATWRTSDDRCQYFYAPDQDAVPSAWTQLGTDTSIVIGNLFNTVAPIILGGRGGGGILDKLSGSVRYFQVAGSIGGAAACSFDAVQLAEPYSTYTDAQGNIWTLNRAASGRKLCVVDRNLLLLGTDDYLEVPDHALIRGETRGFTWVFLGRAYGAPFGSGVGFERHLSKKSTTGTAAGWSTESNGTTANMKADVADGTTRYTAAAAVYSDGMPFLSGGVLRAGQLYAINPDGSLTSPISVTGPITSTDVLRLGSQTGSPGAYFNGEFFAAAIMRESLSAAEINRLKMEMLT